MAKTAQVSLNDLSSTAWMLVTFEKNNNMNLLGLKTGENQPGLADLEKISTHLGKSTDEKIDLNTFSQQIKFESKIAHSRREIKNHTETNAIKAFLNETQDYIVKIKDDKTGLNARALGLLEELNKLEDDLKQLSDTFLKTCEERLAAKKTNNKEETAKFEEILKRDLLPKTKKIFDEEKKLQEKIRLLHQDTTNAARLRGVIIPPPAITFTR